MEAISSGLFLNAELKEIKVSQYLPWFGKGLEIFFPCFFSHLISRIKREKLVVVVSNT